MSNIIELFIIKIIYIRIWFIELSNFKESIVKSFIKSQTKFSCRTWYARFFVVFFEYIEINQFETSEKKLNFFSSIVCVCLVIYVFIIINIYCEIISYCWSYFIIICYYLLLLSSYLNKTKFQVKPISRIDKKKKNFWSLIILFDSFIHLMMTNNIFFFIYKKHFVSSNKQHTHTYATQC